jgi:hypothetical protein
MPRKLDPVMRRFNKMHQWVHRRSGGRLEVRTIERSDFRKLNPFERLR